MRKTVRWCGRVTAVNLEQSSFVLDLFGAGCGTGLRRGFQKKSGTRTKDEDDLADWFVRFVLDLDFFSWKRQSQPSSMRRLNVRKAFPLYLSRSQSTGTVASGPDMYVLSGDRSDLPFSYVAAKINFSYRCFCFPLKQ